jgi:uncharacterized repeat protein (TIGR01451 family)
MKWLAPATALAMLAVAAPVSAVAAVGTGADLQVSGSASAGSPAAGAPFSYTFQIKNSGPDSATSAVFTDVLQAGTVYNSASVGGISNLCSAVDNGAAGVALSCTLGSLAKGGQVGVLVNVSAPVTPGAFSNTGTATSGVPDPLPANNSATVTVQVKAAVSVPSGVVTYSNLGAVPPIANGAGWAIVGQQLTGFFSYIGEQFTAAVSGSVSSISLPIHQYDTGGNGSFVLQFYTDSAATPNTIGTLLGTYQGKSIRTGDPSTALTTIAVANGIRFVAGQRYWMTVQPSPQSREAWAPNQVGALGTQMYVDPYQTLYTPDNVQAAFEIKVAP